MVLLHVDVSLIAALVETEHAAEFLPKTNLLQLFTSIMSNSSAGSVLRSRAMMISGRMLFKEKIFKFMDESSETFQLLAVLEIISAIKARVGSSESVDEYECESALEAIGPVDPCCTLWTQQHKGYCEKGKLKKVFSSFQKRISVKVPLSKPTWYSCALCMLVLFLLATCALENLQKGRYEMKMPSV